MRILICNPAYLMTQSFYLNSNYSNYNCRQKLEDIATAALQSNTVGQVQKLFDQYVNFICLGI